MNSILIVEDDVTYGLMLKAWLGKKGFRVTTAGNVARAQRVVETEAIDLILSDLRLPDRDGIDLLRWIGEQEKPIPLIMMTNYADIQSAVQAMKLGASDYVAKPVNPDELLKKMGEALQKSSQMARREESHSTDNWTAESIEGESEAARQLYNYVRLVAPTQMSVLICGASGTGKEYVARRIHQLSKRANCPFVAIDCGAIPKELAASEFFGHVKGAFTGALTDKAGAFVEADGGTLFLDEIGNLGYEVQVGLLRALQERKIRPVGSSKEMDVDVRLVCATNEDLGQAISHGTFREDLYHRLNEFTLRMPLLRERREDILLFADHFLREANRELDKHLEGFDGQAARALLSYPWPGNLRQMKNLVRRATLLAKGRFITLDELGDLREASPVPFSMPLHDEAAEKQRIAEALRQTEGNKSRAAKLLGIDRKTLYNKLKA